MLGICCRARYQGFVFYQGFFKVFSQNDDNVVRSLTPAVDANAKVATDVASLLWNIAGLGQALQAFPRYRQAIWQALPWQAWPQQARKGKLVIQDLDTDVCSAVERLSISGVLI